MSSMNADAAQWSAIIYTRVSSLGRSVSVQDQEKECRAVCGRNGWPIRAVFCDDGISASRYGKDRPAWTALKGELRPGDVLVVWEASRAHRDLEEYVTLRNLCAELKVPLSYSGRILNLAEGDDRFVAGLDALVAERESEQIRARVLRGQRGGLAKGRPHTRPPWGYRIKAPGEWEPDPVEAPRVKTAIERLLAGESQASVYRWLKSTGRAPATASSLQRTFASPSYAGIRVHQGQPAGKGAWEPLITEAQHLELTTLFRSRKLRDGYAYRPGQTPKHLLSLIATCGKCHQGLTFTRLGQSGEFYRCPQGHVTRSAPLMDKAVEAEILAVLADVDPNEVTPGDEDAQEAQREVEELEDKLEEWMQSAEKGEVTPAAFARVEKGIRERIEALKPRMVAARGPSPEEILAEWPLSSVTEKRDVIRAYLQVTAIPSDKGRRNGTLLIERIELG